MAVEFRESVKDTLENLIEQFSDVYCFYRELIQNSLDAGTNRVDIYFEYIPPDKDKKDGIMIIHIDDYGEGMNRDIIDLQLTRLFSSSKEDDQTKIGKFGIGFVSVFAIKPDAVNIDTSRDGEDWRILFKRDKTFERLKRDYPVDGTKIQIIKSCNEKFFEIFKQKSRETVEFWCKHSEAEIYFEDEQINKPFDIDSPLKLHFKEEAAEVVTGYTQKREPFLGFYNQGLTLLEGEKDFTPFITFKIKSKYLEHTLTRDNIRQDENYFKAMKVLDKIIKNQLPQKLFNTLEKELISSEEETHLYKDILWFGLLYMADTSTLPAGCINNKIARDVEGNYITVKDLVEMKNQGAFYFDTEPNIITKSFSFAKKNSKKIIKTKPSQELYKQLHNLALSYWNSKNIVQISRAFFTTEIIETKKLNKTQKGLIESVDFINRKLGNKTAPLKFADFSYPGSCIKDKVYVMQEKPGEITAIDAQDKKNGVASGLFKFFSKTRTLILNHEHSYVKGLLELSKKDHHMAAYFLTKLLYLDDGIETKTDSCLASIALKRGGI